MKNNRRHWIGSFCLAVCVLGPWSVQLTSAQDYPSKSIRVLVPFAPGGVVDTSTRIVTNKIIHFTSSLQVQRR